MESLFARLLALLLLALAPSIAIAHPEGFSGLRVDVGDTSVRAVLTLHTRDMGSWFPPAKYPHYVDDVCHALAAQAPELLELSTDGETLRPASADASLFEVGLIEVDIDYALPANARTLEVWSKHLPHLPNGHQQLLVIERKNGAGAADVLCEDTLTVDHDSATAELETACAATTGPTTSTTASAGTTPRPPAAPRHRISFFALGVEHIITGYDHLLFLAALLLVCTSFRQAASVITFFTVAHSITLSLAALNLVRMPGRIVEPAIAASIVYVGLENIFGRHRFGWRAGVTFGFGLVHGLGFASALREVGLGSTGIGIAWPLVKFSVGLESGQLTIAAVLLYFLLAIRRRAAQPLDGGHGLRWVTAGSLMVSMIGAYWFVARVMTG